MKILTVVHRFLPRHHTGAELYSYRLAQRLALEHDVTVFAADDDLMRRNYSREITDVDGLRVITVQNHRKYANFAHSYADPSMEKLFARVLQVEQPDIVHFQHLLHHSLNYGAIAQSFGVPSVMTLHEYWLLCARNGQLFDADENRCDGPGLEKCSSCMSRFMWGRSNVDVWMLRGILGVKKLTGMNLKATARKLRLRRLSDTTFVPAESQIEKMKKGLLLREASVRDLLESVDCLIAPSRFLRDRFLEFGVDADCIVHSDYGTEMRDFRNLTKTPHGDGPLRIGFLGSMQPVKGVHVLLEALGHLESDSFEAELYGDIEAKPEYVQKLGDSFGQSVRLKGKAPAKDIPRILSSLDVLVVPSIWWENSPLVIHEAFAAGVPVVCSDVGGMSELIEHGKSGFHFKAGSAIDLAACLSQLSGNRKILAEFRSGIPILKDMKTDAAFHDQLFEAILSHYEELEQSAIDDEENDVLQWIADHPDP